MKIAETKIQEADLIVTAVCQDGTDLVEELALKWLRHVYHHTVVELALQVG